MERTRVACDRCHELKVKCQGSLQGCRRCRRLNLPCTSQRAIRKPGRKPSDRSPIATQTLVCITVGSFRLARLWIRF
ncbi:hypothetical protein BX600DRAFT_466733 [Xylariales sp. PMI_506]|nr:hypothetical protein BX600DRAFT_466733 [Xylariales sp. PMI_506]